MARDWILVCPLAAYRDMEGVFSRPVDLAEGVVLQRTPDWVKNEKLDFLSAPSREGVRDSSVSLCLEYEGDELRGHQEAAEQEILIANLALWLAKPAPVGTQSRLHFRLPRESDGGPVSAAWGGMLLHHGRDEREQFTTEDLDLAADLHRTLIKLGPDSLLWTALNVLRSALCDEWWQSRFLFFWVAVETLFGPENAQEMAFRLSTRVALFLGTDHDNALSVRDTVRTGYRWRSRTVHGHRLDKLDGKKSEQISHEVERLLRDSMVKILRDDELVAVFNGRDREEHLDSLAFRGVSAG